MKSVLLFGCALAACATTALAAPASVSSADALKWLVMVDKGEYAQSWRDAGDLFKSHITEADWERQAGPVRKPMGMVVSRKLQSEQQAKNLPGAPAGDYDIIKFDTVFGNKQSVVETLVLKHEPTGWKVEGYFIK